MIFWVTSRAKPRNVEIHSTRLRHNRRSFAAASSVSIAQALGKDLPAALDACEYSVKECGATRIDDGVAKRRFIQNRELVGSDRYAGDPEQLVASSECPTIVDLIHAREIQITDEGSVRVLVGHPSGSEKSSFDKTVLRSIAEQACLQHALKPQSSTVIPQDCVAADLKAEEPVICENVCCESIRGVHGIEAGDNFFS